MTYLKLGGLKSTYYRRPPVSTKKTNRHTNRGVFFLGSQARLVHIIENKYRYIGVWFLFKGFKQTVKGRPL
jgi:hypothetical protein